MIPIQYEGKKYNLTTEDVSRIFGYNRVYFQKMAQKGALPHIRRGWIYLFNEQEVQQVLLSRFNKHDKCYPYKGDNDFNIQGI